MDEWSDEEGAKIEDFEDTFVRTAVRTSKYLVLQYSTLLIS